MSMKVEGMDELLKKLNELDKKGKKIKNKALKSAGKILLEEIKSNTPVKTGKLKSSMVISRIKKNKENGSYIQVGTNKEGWYAPFVEFGTTKTPQTNFMSRSFENKKEEVQEEIKNHIKKELNL